ncbi:MAG: (d)CMP kinase [Bacteroidetes bacterium]|nr:(d)CMP kinase [Bacteroidota bacterium]
MPQKKITIAVDGYSSCGKSTLAKDIAKALNYAYVDTGAMYRAVTLYALNNGLINGKQLDVESLNDELDDIHIRFTFNPETGVSEIFLNEELVEQQIRQMDVNDWVSQVAAVPEVRRKMVSLQQQMGKEKGISMDGRDIGTTVFPDAELKLFMTADLEVRARRRRDEMVSKNMQASLEEIKANLLHRDQEDMSRQESPLRKADDAIILDNTNLTREQQLAFALEKASRFIG